MDRFALIAIPDGGRRMIEQHSLLKKLPQSWSRKLVNRLSPGFTGTITEKDTREELGYMMDVPSFFAEWDKLGFSQREKQLKVVIHKLRSEGIHTVVFPYWSCYLVREEIEYMEANSLIVLDGYKIRLNMMIQAFDYLTKILKAYLPSMEVGIWRADNDVGEIWAKLIAKQFNYVTLGGLQREELTRISDQLMHSTGLSCQITDNIDECILDKDIVIATSDIEVHKITEESLIFNAANLKCYEIENYSLLIDSGWPGIPHDIMVDIELKPWEEIALLEGVFYSMSENYRRIAVIPRVTEDQMQHIQHIFKLYPLRVKGIITGSREISFDKFRMDFLNRFIDKYKNKASC